MKYFYLLILFSILFAFAAFADGTKQLMPNCGTENSPSPKGNCYLALGSREGGTGLSRPFARYNNSDGESCDSLNRLYINIKSTEEEIHFGFGNLKNGTSNQTIKYRIKSPSGVIVKAEGTIYYTNNQINNYAQAYYGPNTCRTDGKGYNPIIFEPTETGDYYIEFNIGTDFNQYTGTAVDFENFDISVVEPDPNNIGKYKQIEGRLYSMAWGLNSDASANEVWASFYTIANDGYISKVYMAGSQPFRFVFGCNSFGSLASDSYSMEKKRKSYFGGNTFTPEYLVFLTRPADNFLGDDKVAKVPTIPQDLTLAGNPVTCEDLIFVITLLYNETSTLELLLDTDEDGYADKVLADLLEASRAQARGFHYPWKDKDEIKTAGIHYYVPLQATGCDRSYRLSLFDQRFSYDGKGQYIPNGMDTVFGPGDDDFDKNKVIWNEQLGTEKNPILIDSYEDLDFLISAVSNAHGGNIGTYTYTIDNFALKYKDAAAAAAKDKNETVDLATSFDITSSDGFRGVYFYVTKSITLPSNWAGIGKAASPFKGIFQTGTYTPNPNLTYSNDFSHIIMNGCDAPLFNYCDGATIINVTIDSTSTTDITKETVTLEGLDYSGISNICNVAKNTNFLHCKNQGNIELNSPAGDEYVGGIVGFGYNCTLDSCLNSGEITYHEEGFVGGIAGGMLWDTNPTNDTVARFCFNSGTLNADGGIIGGIIGQATLPSGIIANCRNEGALNYYTTTNAIGGGIVGKMADKGKISDCYNSGTISDLDNSGIASGIVGKSNSATIAYCMNTGIIESNLHAYPISDDNNCTYSIASVPTPTYYDGDKTSHTEADFTTICSTYGLTLTGTNHYMEDGEYVDLIETVCCGKNWRMEDAGRLYKNDSTFYIKWDGKDNDGECVTGEVEVHYQKNSGVTHFPFFDPENNNVKGLIVYRISPIQDTITMVSPSNQTAYQAAEGITSPEYYGYKQLPKDYYNTTNFADEYGIELNLFWDDTDIGMLSSCDQTTNEGYIIGENIHIEGSSTTESYCTSCSKNKCTGSWKYAKTAKGYVYYCEQCKYGCSNTTTITVGTADIDSCKGIENVTLGGYLGSDGGGHLFPEENFGNQNTINTWWNGVEVASYKTLILNPYSNVLLLPIVLSEWNATNLTDAVLLHWVTASEDNNYYFNVERSIDGVNWINIGKVFGAGTTSISNSYSLEDRNPVSGISYYRLKQTDFNGNYTYSSIKTINRPNKDKDSFFTYADKTSNSLYVEGYFIAACPIEVYNTVGSKVTELSFNTLSTSKVRINAGKLPAGTYFIKICNETKSVVKNW